MKIECKKNNLSNAVLNIQNVVSTKSSIPALEGILIKTEENKIKLCGYDLELGVTTLIEAKVEEPGSIVLNAKLFSEIVRKTQSENITIKTDSKLITEITGGESKFSIVGITPEEYPELPRVDETSTLSLPGNTLKSMIRQTIFAISESDAKPIHTGTLFEIEKNKIRLVSVDGYRLAIREEQITSDIKTNFVVPGKALKEIVKLLGDNETETEIKIGNRHILFNIENYTVISRLLEGDFLDYHAAIPQKSETTAKIKVNEMVDSVSRVSLIITERLKSPVRCIFGENEIKLSSASSIGKASDNLKAEIIGNDVEIGFNNSYFLDALNHTECDEVKISLGGPLSPIKITPLDGESFIFLVLPVRLNNSIS